MSAAPTTAEFVLELRAEEIPAGYLAPAATALRESVEKALRESGIAATGLETSHTPRRIVLRTFSKCHGLAGLRCGYLVGDSSRVGDLARRQPPFSVSTVAQHAAGAALRDDAHRGRSVRLNAAERERVGDALTRRGVAFVAGHGNFLMVNTWPLPALDAYERLLRRGIIVRPLDDYRLASHIRVTIGLPEENTSFVEHLAHVLES